MPDLITIVPSIDTGSRTTKFIFSPSLTSSASISFSTDTDIAVPAGILIFVGTCCGCAIVRIKFIS